MSDDEFFFLDLEANSVIRGRCVNGARALVRRQAFVESGRLGVVRVAGQDVVLVQMRFLEDGKVLLQESNPFIPPRLCSSDEVGIWGQVVKIEIPL